MNDKWWQTDVPRLIKRAEDLYDAAIKSGQTYTMQSVTQSKIVQLRKWEQSLPLTNSNFSSVLKELECFYFPKTHMPGPMVVFPLRDIYGQVTRAQTKPMEGSIESGSNYRYLGTKAAEFFGPCWIGSSSENIKRIIKTRKVVVVEGGFDILACKLVAPDVPILCPLTKSLGKDHVVYLRMLGVETLYLMFDNEKPKEDYDIGAGEISMRTLKKKITDMEVEILFCPSSDPSEALKLYPKARQLKSLLCSL